MVQLNRPLAEGDCGSVIINKETGGLYRHIIASYKETRTVYIMSAHAVFKDAEKHLGSDIILSGAISPVEFLLIWL